MNAFCPLNADDIASGVGVEANTYCVILFHVGEGEEGGQFDVVVNEDLPCFVGDAVAPLGKDIAFFGNGNQRGGCAHDV